MAVIEKLGTMITSLSVLEYLERHVLTQAQADRLLLKFAPNGREQLLYLGNVDTGRAVIVGGDANNDECINVYAGNLRDFSVNNLPFERDEYVYYCYSPGEYERAGRMIIINLFEMTADQYDEAVAELPLYDEVAAERQPGAGTSPQPDGYDLGPAQTAEAMESFDSNGNPSDGAQGWYCESCTGTNPMPQDHFCCETPGCYGRLEVTGRFQY
jgi:hypothetical protein